jgi:hypothetical protein
VKPRAQRRRHGDDDGDVLRAVVEDDDAEVDAAIVVPELGARRGRMHTTALPEPSMQDESSVTQLRQS